MPNVSVCDSFVMLVAEKRKGTDETLHVNVEYVSFEQCEDHGYADDEFRDKIGCIVCC